MRTALSTLEVMRPRSLGAALDALAAPNRPTPLAGGTDLMVYLNAGALPARRFVDLWGLRELRGVRAAAGCVRIGALTTFSEIQESALVRRRWPALVAAAAVIGARQIQNRATLGGNIVNASPAGDSLPVLLAHDAVVHARSKRGARALPMEAFYLGYRSLALEPDELVEAVALAAPPPGVRWSFRKVGTRRAQSISKVVFAGLLAVDRAGKVDRVRLAYGSMAPVPARARAAEERLLGARPSATALAGAVAALDRDLAPIDDIRSEREYRQAVAANVLARFLLEAHPGFSRA